MLDIKAVHHVSVPVRDLVLSKAFYGQVLGLQETERPAFNFGGAWYKIGEGQLHLIVGDERASYRTQKPVDSHDVHFAIRVGSFRQALEHMLAIGYSPTAKDPLRVTKENPVGTAGFPQLYVLDPDRNVIEINAETLD